jgi:hypothetical protein
MKEDLSIFVQIGLPYFLLISLAPLSFLLYRKMNVCIERRILRALRKNFHVRLMRHTHPHNSRYRQCHRTFGFGHVWPERVHPGFLETSLPQTISYEFEVRKSLKVGRLEQCVVDALASEYFTIKLLTRPHKMTVVNLEVLDKKKNSTLKVHIIHLRDTVYHRRYRLVTTWLS